MAKLTLILVIVAVVVLGGLALRSFANNSNSKMPQTGEMAPNFTLPSENGNDVSLDSLRGKWVVLYFYPADMTPGCTIEAHNFEHDLARYKTLNAEIVGVSVQSVASHKKFCAKDHLTFTLLSDTGKKVVEKYGSLGDYMGYKIAKRNTFLLNPEGKIVKVWTKVDPAHHSQQVLAALHQFQKR
ncbi:MAG TPA: peroxiredoxin [Acidobacteriaceae bacterium]|nr:peroxiredoxin [Acidobacteriaceae bacterium]